MSGDSVIEEEDWRGEASALILEKTGIQIGWDLLTEDVSPDSRVPLQAPPRRKAATIVPAASGQKNKETIDIPGGQSVNSTITSVNSISSLLKEKLQLSIPAALRSSKKQQHADYR